MLVNLYEIVNILLCLCSQFVWSGDSGPVGIAQFPPVQLNRLKMVHVVFCMHDFAIYAVKSVSAYFVVY
jgi:hypothetical protein